jgi:hypothetical protein
MQVCVERNGGAGLRQDEEEMYDVGVCSAVNACVCEYNKSE